MGKSLTVSLVRKSSDTTPQLPAGFGRFVVRDYPIHGHGVDLDAVQRGSDMWAVVPLWVPETKSFSAIDANVARFDNLPNLWNLQPQDGVSVDYKMRWLVNPSKGNTPMWTSGADWDKATFYFVGCQLWAGQPCAASLDTFEVNIKGSLVTCRKVLPFKKADWNISPNDAPWLYPYVTIASKRDNSIVDRVYDRGQIRVMQQVLKPADYPFIGGVVPSAFYVPVEWVTLVV